MRTFDWYSKSMTLDELEQPLCSLVSFTSYVIGTSYEKLIDPYYQEQRCNATTLVSVNIMRSQGFLGERVSINSGVIENLDFRMLHIQCLGK